MADISRFKKKRRANKNAALGLFTKAKDFMAKDYSVENKKEIETLLKTIESKVCRRNSYRGRYRCCYPVRNKFQ